MQQVDLKVWKEQKAFRDWDYEKQQAHEQATKMLHKVPLYCSASNICAGFSTPAYRLWLLR